MATLYVFLSVIGSMLQAVHGVGCQNGWTQFEGSCYLYNNQRMDFPSAAAYCMENGGHLAEIETEKEQKFIVNHLKNLQTGSGVWVGGNDRLAEGYWVWDHSEMPFDYTNWYKTEPSQPVDSDGEQDCLAIWTNEDYQWADYYCDHAQLEPFCEASVVGCN